MSFAIGGDEAIEWLEKEAFDIVITDMRMPGLSGADLLKNVKTLVQKLSVMNWMSRIENNVKKSLNSF